MTIEEIIKRYDDPNRKGFDYHFITSELGTLEDSEKERPEYQFEMIAFMLVPNANNAWAGHYYGPMFTLTDENGKPFENPSLQSITPCMVAYWKQRLENVQNPLLKSQYINLILDFEKSTTGIYPTASMYDDAVETMLAVVEGGYCRHQVVAVKYLKRAFDLSQNTCIRNKVKSAFVDFEQKNAKDDTAAGIWGVYLNVMIDNAVLFTTDERKALISKHEERLQRLSLRNPGATDEPALDPFAVEQQVRMLADYYSKIEKSESDVIRVLEVYEVAAKRCFSEKPATYKMAQLQSIIQLYNAYSIKSANDRLTAEIQQIASLAKREMEHHSFQIEIPNEQINTLMEYLLEGDDQLRLLKYVDSFIPKEKVQESMVKKNAKNFPLVFMMNNQLLDEKGRPASVIGSIENDLEGHVVLQTSQVMQMEGFLLRMITERLQDAGVLSVENVVRHISESPLFEPERVKIIQKALSFMFDGEGYIAAHLLIPQIEHALVNLVESTGGSVLNIRKDGKGFDNKTLSQLIHDDAVKNVLSPDAAFYLHVLLTDNRGWNVRNKIVHGNLPVDAFPTSIADRLLHVIVMLGFVQKKK